MSSLQDFKEELTPIVDWLTYRSYESNRARNPHIAPHKWRLIFQDAITFEEIYENNIKSIYQGEFR